jgi:hypothetical protein
MTLSLFAAGIALKVNQQTVDLSLELGQVVSYSALK